MLKVRGIWGFRLQLSTARSVPKPEPKRSNARNDLNSSLSKSSPKRVGAYFDTCVSAILMDIQEGSNACILVQDLNSLSLHGGGWGKRETERRIDYLIVRQF